MRRHYSVVISLLGIAACAVPAAGQQSQAVDAESLLEYVRQAEKSRRSLLGNVKLGIRLIDRSPAEQGGWEVDATHRREVIFKNDRQRRQVWRREAESGEMELSGTTIRNGDVVLRYYPTDGNDSRATRGRASRGRNARDMRAAETDQLFGGRFAYTLSDVLDSDQLQVAPKAVEIDGLRCVKLSAPLPDGRGGSYTMSYWICPGRDALPVKMELREADGTLRKSMQVQEFRQMEDGRWFPARLTDHQWLPDDAGELREIRRTSWAVADVQLDPNVSDDMFRTTPDAVPEGYLFQDAITGTAYTVGEGPVSDERLRRVIDDTIDRFGGELDGLGEEVPSGAEPTAETAPRPVYAEEGMAATDPAPSSGDTKVLPIALSVGGLVLLAVATGLYVLHRRRNQDASAGE